MRGAHRAITHPAASWTSSRSKRPREAAASTRRRSQSTSLLTIRAMRRDANRARRLCDALSSQGVTIRPTHSSLRCRTQARVSFPTMDISRSVVSSWSRRN
jgi:hypothetical protein